MPQEFSDRVKIHAGHDQSTGEGMAIAMPGVAFERGSLNGCKEPAAWTLCPVTQEAAGSSPVAPTYVTRRALFLQAAPDRTTCLN